MTLTRDILIARLSRLLSSSQNCNQDLVNLCVGLWWCVSVICSLVAARAVYAEEETKNKGERLLKPNHASPLGYKVPKLPDFEIDPCCETTSSFCLSMHLEFALGIVLALVVGTVITAFAFTEKDEHAYDTFKDFVAGLYR